MESSIKNKERFLLQYQATYSCFENVHNTSWFIVPNIVFGPKVDLGNTGLKNLEELPPLELKHIAYAKMEDIKHCLSKIFADGYEKHSSYLEYCESQNYDNDQMKRYFLKAKYLFSLEIYDYLRSKGYAVPWNGITVEELVELGWIKLI